MPKYYFKISKEKKRIYFNGAFDSHTIQETGNYVIRLYRKGFGSLILKLLHIDDFIIDEWYGIKETEIFIKIEQIKENKKDIKLRCFSDIIIME